MSDDEYNKKLESLQNYIPFLDNMILQLKDPNKKNREQQLSKMESLHAMITDRKRKLKLETLNKCEDVISKLYLKVNHKPLQINSDSTSRSTPASPSPTHHSKDIFDIKPVPIPTERSEPKSFIQKVDVYSSAAESLRKAKSKLYEVSYCAGKSPDVSKPPISLDDLKCLEVDVQEKINESASLKELNDMRNKIATQLIFEKIKSINPTLTTDSCRESSMDRSRNPDFECDSPSTSVNLKVPPTSNSTAKPSSLIVTSSSKVLKGSSSIVDSIISNLDEKFKEETKKDDRRIFLTKDDKSRDKSKEGRNSKEENKSKDVDLSEKKSSKEKLPSTTEKTNVEKDRRDKKHKKNETQSTDNSDGKGKVEEKFNITKRSEIKLEDPRRAKNKPVVAKYDLEPKLSIPSKVVDAKESKTEIKPSAPVFKRLADKYNPKPRKPTIDADVDKVVADSIEQNMKSSPPKIPVINRLTELPPPPPASLVKCSQLEPELPNQHSNVNTFIPSLIHNQLSRANLLSQRNTLPPSSSLLSPRDTFLSPPNPSMLMSPRDNFASASNSSVPMSPRDNFASAPNPSVLMSPRDNFVSEYARDEFNSVNHRRQRFEPQPPLIPPNNRFLQSSIGQRYNSSFNNYQNHLDSTPQLDFQSSNLGPSSHQYNAMPPLLSPEVPHFQEQKQPYGVVNRELYLHKEDLRWRLEDNRPSWERRDYDARFRGPMTYREHRELRENSRDPRVTRDPRDNRERDSRDKDIRDPRLNREKETKERENKDITEKESRDPRLNRDLERGRSRNREDFKFNRFESKFDRMYSRTNKERSPSRSSSRSRAEAKEKDTFISPLDSLYNVREEHKTGKGYGVQTFRIPKKKKDEKEQSIDLTTETQKDEEDSSDSNNVIVDHNIEDNHKNVETFSDTLNKNDESTVSSTVNDNENIVDLNLKESESENTETTEDNNAIEECDVSDKMSETANVDPKIMSPSTEEIPSSNIEDLDKPTKIDTDSKTESKTEIELQTISKSEESESTKPHTEQRILAQFFTNLLGSSDKKEKKTALYSLISTFSDTFSTKELSKITKIIHANEEDENTSDEESKKEDDTSKKEEEDETVKIKNDAIVENTSEHEDKPEVIESEEIVPPKITKRKLRSRRISSISPTKQNTEEVATNEATLLENMKTAENTEIAKQTETAKNEETSEKSENSMNTDMESEVLVTVGERIKSRKRIAALVDKPKKKVRSELDRLHEDIQEMFIRDGVLTASGKRMCHLLKDDTFALNTVALKDTEEIVRTRKKPGPKSKLKQSNDTDVSSMKHVRIIIHKIPDATMEESVGNRRLTRSMTAPESDEESSVSTEVSTKEASDVEDNNESSDSDKESSSQPTDNTQKAKALKRKRPKSSWAAGIIKRKKKKQNAEEPSQQKVLESEDAPVKDTFLTPDKDYYVDFISQKSYGCRLCDFQGRFITTHYKQVHPESEVMSSRFTPTLASEALNDAKINMTQYETYQMTKPSAKITYACRFCTFTTTVAPTLFYDHISTHTGEYRHICPNCSVSSCSGKTLKVHMLNNHKGKEKPVVRKSYGAVVIFGYVCGECNYVQMNRKNVEEHVNIYHLVRPPIHKINLSNVFDEEIKKLYNLETDKVLSSSEAKPKAQDENIGNKSSAKLVFTKQQKEKELLQCISKDVEDKEESKDLPEQSSSLERTSTIPKKPRAKPGPKSKKRPVVPNTSNSTVTISSQKEADTSKSINIRRSVDDLDTDKILPFRSKRAAKEKAQEKLKEIMEMNDSLTRKKSSNEEKKERSETKETDATAKITEKSDDIPVEEKTSSNQDEQIFPEVDTKLESDLKEVKKEIEMNVFTCNTDIQEENKQIEQERLQKMQELNKSVGSRTSLNFVDKLCNRLNQNDVKVKEEPNDDFIDKAHQILRINSPITMPILEKNPPTATVSAKITPAQIKKPTFETEIHASTPTFDVAQKNDKSIVDMIEKLKGKLGADDNFSIDSADEYDNDGPPPLTHVNELTNVKPSNASTKTLEVCGLVKVIKTDESTMFCCLVPPCVFSTENKDQFQRHCKENHSAGALRNSTLCETCGVQINSTSDANLLENLFKHTIIQHADFIQNDTPVVSVKPPARMLRIRKLSGDALSVIKNDPENQEMETDSLVDDSNDNKVFPTINILDATNTNVIDNNVQDDNPFPFKISGVMSLAEPQQHAPPLAPIVKQNMQIVVKEAKLTTAESTKPRKTLKALAKFIEEVGNLYKCPHYYCLFTTNYRDLLDKHLKAHNTEKDAMIPCVYCDLKTPWEHVAIHIDIRHGNCKYACSYCLYRACSKEYVFLHQDRSHSFQDYSVIALPTPKTHKKFAIADVKIDPKTLCSPYRCVPICNMEFLFENEFREHLVVAHKQNTFITCGHDTCTSRVTLSKMVAHWSTAHGVSVYQCGYCKTNSNELNQMYHHLSQFHQNLSPNILVRLATPKPAVSLCYSTEAFKRMRKIATLPNITEGEKGGTVSTPVDQSQEVPKTVPNTATHFTKSIPITAPPKTVLPSSSPSTVTTSASNLFLITNSSTGANSLMQVNATSPNTLLKVNTDSPTSGGSLSVIPTAKSSTPAEELSASVPPPSDPLAIQEPNSPISTLLTEQSANLQKAQLENVDPSERTNIPGSAHLEDTNKRPILEESSVVAHTNVIPLEHVNLSEDNNQDEPTGCDVDPLDLGESINSQSAAYSSEEESDNAKSDKSKNKFGLLGYQLFRCAFCEFSCSNSNDFRNHVSKSVQCKSTDNINKPFMCVHCKKPFRNSNILCDHIQCHGILRFSCSLCGSRFPTSGQARAHMKNRHNVSQTTMTPLNAGKVPVGSEEYIIKPKLLPIDLPPKDSTAAEPSSLGLTPEHTYHPDQIDKIPIRSIFSLDLRCGICTYATKVRTNMVRHLQFHSQEKSVPDTAPVNPVPCLEKNEKMFDKMVNLASSSHKSGGRMGGASKSEVKDTDNVPDFVPSHTRYTCCAQGCNYICPEEGNLRHHLMALHGEDATFICVHCKSQLTPTDADSLIKHLKLHGLQLYKCHYCNFVHYQKHKIEKHCSDIHADLPAKVIIVRCLESEPKDSDDSNNSTPIPVSNQNKCNKPWKCCMCKTKSATQEGIQSHVLEKHDIDSQYKCALCAYKTNDKTTFEGHFMEDHKNQDINIIGIYRKIEEDPKEDKEPDPFDTTPLWQRDRPRVRHIRGILFDESSPVSSKSPKKPTKTPSSTVTSSALKTSTRNMDLSIDAVASGSAGVLKDNGEDFIDQVNKLMKTAKRSIEEDDDLEIIIIDDEENMFKTGTKTKPSAPSGRNTTDEPEKKKIKVEEIDGVESHKLEDELTELSLLVTFGDFGQPLNKQLRCPDCNKFKSKRISDFIFHLFKEKKVYRYKCGICGDESITYRYMSKHVKEHNNEFDIGNIMTMPRNPRLEIWLQMLIRMQCVKIVGTLSAPAEVAPDEKKKVLCRYCNKWYRSEHERNEHAIFHWNCIPFKCSECSFDSFTRIHMVNHFHNAHPNGNIPNIIAAGPTVASELQFADFLHVKEVEEEINQMKAIDSPPKKTTIAEVLMPEVVMPDMIDESEQDGTQGMAYVLDSTVKMPEVSQIPANHFEPGDDVNDLVILTKTDTNVPLADDVFCCEYCPYMSSSEMLMLSHISGHHEHMHIKFKVLNQTKCENKTEDYVACAICKEVGSEIRIRQHHLELHEGETFHFYRYTCCGCYKRFIKISGLKLHFQRVHPGVQLKCVDIFDNIVSLDPHKATKDKTPKEKLRTVDFPMQRCVTPSPSSSSKAMKHYQCTECSYKRDFARNGLSNVKYHVRNHFKAFTCGHCGLQFKIRHDVAAHYRKEHPEFEENIIHDDNMEEQFQNVMRIITDTAVPVSDSDTSPRPSPSQTPNKQTARKSTSAVYSLPLEEYSFYGIPAEAVDLNKIMTSVDINGMCLEMSADRLGKIFDLNPSVYIEKCDEPSLEDSIIDVDS